MDVLLLQPLHVRDIEAIHVDVVKGRSASLFSNPCWRRSEFHWRPVVVVLRYGFVALEIAIVWGGNWSCSWYDSDCGGFGLRAGSCGRVGGA